MGIGGEDMSRQRLIDANKIEYKSTNEIGMEYYGNVLFAAKPQIEREPTVYAIPIEWMDAQIRGYASRLQSTELKALVLVKQMWEREQEAQDGKGQHLQESMGRV